MLYSTCKLLGLGWTAESKGWVIPYNLFWFWKIRTEKGMWYSLHSISSICRFHRVRQQNQGKGCQCTSGEEQLFPTYFVMADDPQCFDSSCLCPTAAQNHLTIMVLGTRRGRWALWRLAQACSKTASLCRESSAEKYVLGNRKRDHGELQM